MTPMGLELGREIWNRVCIVDGAQHGDVLSGPWQVGLRNLPPMSCFAEEPVNRPLRTIRERYRQCGLFHSGGERG